MEIAGIDGLGHAEGQLLGPWDLFAARRAPRVPSHVTTGACHAGKRIGLMRGREELNFLSGTGTSRPGDEKRFTVNGPINGTLSALQGGYRRLLAGLPLLSQHE